MGPPGRPGTLEPPRKEGHPIARILLLLFAVLLGSGLAVRGYLAAERLLFLGGLFGLVLALPLALAPGRGRVPLRALRVTLAGSAFAAFLLLAELVWSAVVTLRPPPPLRPFFSYAEAIADPAGFLRWWTLSVRPGVMQLAGFAMPDPRGQNPYVLRPGDHEGRNHAQFHVNQLGFRGPEFPREKGDRFRIVAIGESTTFGLTLLPEHRPWPEVLESRIAEELECDRPVQVINAGVPGWTLANQVTRLPYDILPLKPELIVSYHGFNGFHFFFDALPEVTLRNSATPPPRASRILERVEAAARLVWFRRRYRAVPKIDASVTDEELMSTPYAEWYRRLVSEARAGGSKVALCTFNMAVTAKSPEEAIRLHETLVPDLRARILSNRLHSRLVLELARDLGVVGIDASPGLDGAYRDAYVDVAHFTQLGRERMAANVFDGLRATLRDHPRLHCRPRKVRRASAAHAPLTPAQPAPGSAPPPAGPGQRRSSRAASP